MYKFSAYIFFYRNLKTNIFFKNNLGPPPRYQMVRPLPHSKSAWELQKMTSHKWAFPCIAAYFAKFVRINLPWTYYHLLICKYGKQNPNFNTIKDGRAHRAFSVESRLVQPNEKVTQSQIWTRNVWQNISKKLT